MNSYYPSYGTTYGTKTVERQPLDAEYSGYDDYDLMEDSGYGGADLLSMVSNSYNGGLTQDTYERAPVADKYDLESYYGDYDYSDSYGDYDYGDYGDYDSGYADVDYEGEDYGWDDSVYHNGGQPWQYQDVDGLNAYDYEPQEPEQLYGYEAEEQYYEDPYTSDSYAMDPYAMDYYDMSQYKEEEDMDEYDKL